MNRLDELINQYCPNGVEYKPINEATDMKRGTSLTKQNAIEGDIPVISGGREPAFYHNKANREGAVVTVAGSGAGAGYVQYFETPIFANDCFTLQGKEGVNTKYIYYCLSNMQDRISATKKGGGVPHVHISDIENLEIPVPPLPVQEEIVRILDKFTELEQELKQELELRKKQYEYYRDKMLSLSDYDGEVEEVSLGDKTWFTSIVGGDVPKDALSDVHTDEYNVPIYSNGIGDNALYGWTNRSRVNDACITLSARGTIGYCAYHDMPFYPIVRLISLVPKDINKTNPKFLYYAVSAMTFNVPKNGIPQLTVPMLEGYTIRIPNMSEQKRIVNILDKFSALTEDISEGLPAEIKMRHQQYEYYRDKLLNFKRLEVA